MDLIKKLKETEEEISKLKSIQNDIKDKISDKVKIFVSGKLQGHEWVSEDGYKFEFFKASVFTSQITSYNITVILYFTRVDKLNNYYTKILKNAKNNFEKDGYSLNYHYNKRGFLYEIFESNGKIEDLLNDDIDLTIDYLQ